MMAGTGTAIHSEPEPYMFGLEVVLLLASWDRCRGPVALALIDPTCRGHQHRLFRQRLTDFVPPAWVHQVVVVAEAGCAANATLRLLTEQRSTTVLALPRPRKSSPMSRSDD
jgi:hypothetical protein